MQMLHACGLRCAGDFPSFEPDESRPWQAGGVRGRWMGQFEAVKILDPHRGTVERGDIAVVWLDRSPAMQAVSQLKMAMMLCGFPFQDGAAGKIVRQLREDRPRALEVYAGLPILMTSFDAAIEDTAAFCRGLADFVNRWMPKCDPVKMAACVRPRTGGSQCQPDMAMELSLIGPRLTGNLLDRI